MPYRDLLLPILTYPDATPATAIRSAVALARKVGGDLTALAVEAEIARVGHGLANALIGLDTLAGDEELRSVRHARDALKVFQAAVQEMRVLSSTVTERTPYYLMADAISERARTRDLCLLPVGAAVPAEQGLAEAVLFGSGRPVIVYPDDRPVLPADHFSAVAVAWDGSARAARAVADAIPILQSARQVRVLVVTGEKPQATTETGHNLVRHLQLHACAPFLDHVPADGAPIGRVLTDYVAGHAIDLLVMGGFGHSRTREFILGGATRSMLQAPPCPVLMTH